LFLILAYFRKQERVTSLMQLCWEMKNNKHLCDGNYISVYSKPSSDKTMDQVVKLFSLMQLTRMCTIIIHTFRFTCSNSTAIRFQLCPGRNFCCYISETLKMKIHISCLSGPENHVWSSETLTSYCESCNKFIKHETDTSNTLHYPQLWLQKPIVYLNTLNQISHLMHHRERDSIQFNKIIQFKSTEISTMYQNNARENDIYI
jgi:hypothetical protein